MDDGELLGYIAAERLARTLARSLDPDDEITAVQEMLEEQLAMNRLTQDDTPGGADLAFQNAGQGESLNSQTLPTPMRPGRNAD